MKNNIMLGHIFTFFSILVWGTTFISTKVLLVDLSPVEILLLRFVAAYFSLLIIHPRFYRIESLKEEVMFLLLGLSGVSLYFLSENTALKLSTASNVGLLVSAAPILTAVLAHIFTRDEKFGKNLIFGFIVAFSGIFLVVFNGNFILKLNPVGDLLAITSALMWAIYSIFLKKMGSKYNYIYITRKIFFYGLLTMMPFLPVFKVSLSINRIFVPHIFANLLFLSLVASSLCYVLWNKAVSIIGAVKASNYIYLIPLITIITSVIVLNERITPLAVMGAVMIVSGVYISEHGIDSLIITSPGGFLQKFKKNVSKE